MIHPPLEIWRGTFETKGDHQPLPQNAIGSPKGCLFPFLQAQRHLMITASEVKFGEDCAPPNLVEDVFNSREGLSVECGILIDGTVIPTLKEVGVIAEFIFLPDHNRG